MRTTGDTYISPIEIIDQYSVNKQGVDVGEKYRTGIYSTAKKHLDEAKDFIERREDKDKIVVEVLPLSNYVRSSRATRTENYININKILAYADEVRTVKLK